MEFESPASHRETRSRPGQVFGKGLCFGFDITSADESKHSAKAEIAVK